MKIDRLEIKVGEDRYHIFDPILTNTCEIHRVEAYLVCECKLACNKLDQANFLCSHLIQVLQHKKKKKDIIQSIPNKTRWFDSKAHFSC